MTATQMLYAQLASNIVAGVMVVVSWRYRNVGRLLFVLLFAWAAQVNLRTAVARPHVYLEYAPLAMSGLYRDFIQGFFSRHITLLVSTIAVGQAAIAVLVALPGRAPRLGLCGAVFFLVAITPLGQGAGFPATLIMAAAAGILLRGRYPRSLPAEAWARWRSRRYWA
jgi:hypothetical protein